MGMIQFLRNHFDNSGQEQWERFDFEPSRLQLPLPKRVLPTPIKPCEGRIYQPGDGEPPYSRRPFSRLETLSR